MPAVQPTASSARAGNPCIIRSYPAACVQAASRGLGRRHPPQPDARPQRLGGSFPSRPRHTARGPTSTPSASLSPDAPLAPSSDPGFGARLASLAIALTNAFPVFVVGAAVLGLMRPASFDWFRAEYVTAGLAATMLGMGLTLTFEELRQVLSRPRQIAVGFVLQYTIMPGSAYLISRLVSLPLDHVIGLCLVGSCPGGTASNVVTFLAGADVTLSVAMTAASTLGAVVMTPTMTGLTLGTLVPVDGPALLLSTLQVVLGPVLLGTALNSCFPRAVAAVAPACALSAVAVIALICGRVIAANAAAVLAAGPRLLLAVAALHGLGFALGYFLSRLVGVPERAARTNSIEVGMQNSALGAVLATAHFSAHPLAAVPCAISACMHSVMGSLLAAYWRGRDA
uniref:Uncharacterized protein n=1 Tax=Auxenochlorella protothecoides TaxID=3075 RepID=A0A1D2A3A2_AUXPR